MNLSERKDKTRKQAFAQRKVAQAQGLGEAANQNLIGQLAMYPKAQIISAYMAIRTEVDPLATMAILHGQGKRICVPVIIGEGMPLEFHEWTPDCEMVDGPFGAKVPVNGESLIPDIVIAPLLAFDRKGYRLGYGGGFYDRSFEKFRAIKTVVGIGFAYAAQEIQKVPIETTDQQLDAIVTETEVVQVTANALGLP